MEQTKIDRYVDNLDVNTQANLLKKVLNMLINIDKGNIWLEDVDFVAKQINEFNVQYQETEPTPDYDVLE